VSVDSSLEQLRRLWTPDREIATLPADTAPQTMLDSILRDFLHRVVEQHGPFTLVLERNGEHVLNSGMLRWEVAGILGYREVSLWIEEER
jgi:hypothetical protein